MEQSKIKIIIADDHFVFREGVKRTLEAFDDLEVIAEAADGEALISLSAQMQPDIVLLDLMMPIINGLDATKQLLELYPNTGIIALTMLEDEDKIMDMIYAGAMGYLVKDVSLEQLLEGIRTVHRKIPYFCDRSNRQLTKMLARTRNKLTNEIIQLTSRQKEVIRLVCEQFTSKEIGDQLYLSKKTIDNMRVEIMQKIGCKNTAGIVIYALQNKLFRLD
jgi:DNA-binding NarL/FixJ family response regulator